MKTRETIEAHATEVSVPKQRDDPKARTGRYRGLTPWQPGQSGNPSGRPKKDMAQLIAKEIFEKNPEMIYKAYGKLLRKGSAFGFQVIAERAYGKLKETHEQIHSYQETADADLQTRIDAILRDLGITSQIDAARGIEGTESGASKANGKSQDTFVLPGNGSIKA